MLSDEKLLKRAYHAGRNMAALTVLAGLSAILFVVLSFIVPERGVILGAVALCLLTAAYWMLAVAAYRGDHRAVGVVVGIAAIQLAINFVSIGVLSTKDSSRSVALGGPGILFGLLIMVALFQSYNVLRGLRQRGLWEQVFGACKPSIHLCFAGGTLLVVLWLGFLGYNLYSASQLAAKAKELRAADAFVKMIKGEEQELFASMQGIGLVNSEKLDAALDRLAKLERRASSLRAESSGMEPLTTVLIKYDKALSIWKEALTSLKRSDVDAIEVQRLFGQGDKLRQEATRLFDEGYAKKK